jgi:hypothetical protein
MAEKKTGRRVESGQTPVNKVPQKGTKGLTPIPKVQSPPKKTKK